ncbi:MAG: hypothetical protein FWH06_03250 [Oscillospiraceae bacterium]|nr:hypothetical protein [Oscillospiraceae bacterium]
MKIPPLSGAPAKEQQRKTQQAAEAPREDGFDDAVVITARNRLEPSGAAADFTSEELAPLLNSILQNPENAIGAQSNSTPERVLALLS